MVKKNLLNHSFVEEKIQEVGKKNVKNVEKRHVEDDENKNIFL